MQFLKELLLGLRFVLCVLLLVVVLFCGFVLALEWPEFKLFYIHKMLAEVLVVIALALLLYARSLIVRAFSYLVLILYSLIFYVQIASLHFSGKYLPSIALENAQHVDFLFDPVKVAWFIIIFIAYATSSVMLSKYVKPIPRLRARFVVALLLVVASVLIKNDSRWLQESQQAERFTFYDSGQASIEYKAIGSALSDTLDEYYQAVLREKWIAQASVELPAEAAEFAFDFGYQLNEKSTDFPLLKDLKFTDQPDFIPAADKDPMNVIVFFVEGMSSRIIQPYSDNFPEISPNIERFAGKSLVVDNYYSHSYATYRGLGGQFCSIYANQRLIEGINYRCLPHVLNDKGYETSFFVSQSLSATDLDDVGSRAGFTNIFGSKELSGYIPNDPDRDRDIIYDRSFIDAFKNWLVKKEANESTGSPFFAALYNFQTHTGVHLKPGFQYTDPTNKSSSYVLDTFHNFDYAFKTFLEYFEKSPYADNTIVIVTSDHGTYGSKDFIQLVGHNRDYAPVFVDKIPFIIYHPKMQAGRFDAKRATSLNFAPSLLNVMNFEAKSVPFTGRTIFNQSVEFPKPLVAGKNVTRVLIGGNHWFRQQLGIEKKIPVVAEQAKKHHELVLYLQSLERENRLTAPKAK